MLGLCVSPHVRSWTSLSRAATLAERAAGELDGVNEESVTYPEQRWRCKALQVPQTVRMETLLSKKDDSWEGSNSCMREKGGVGGTKNSTTALLSASNIRMSEAFENLSCKHTGRSDTSSRRSFRKDAGFLGDVSCYISRAGQNELRYWKGTLLKEQRERSNRRDMSSRGRSNNSSDGNFRRFDDNRQKQDFRRRGEGKLEISEGEDSRGKWSTGERRYTVESDTTRGYSIGSSPTDRNRDVSFKGGRSKSISPARFREKDSADNENGTGNSQNLSRRRVKEPKIRPQVHFASAMSKDPHIAILGGGMSGLMCAITLEERGVRSTVFDTGKHGLGGRLATRHISVNDGISLVFDYAAQFFTVSDPQFQKFVDRWIFEGVVKEWQGVVGSLRSGYYLKHAQGAKYIATDGMRSLADHMVSKGELITVKRPCWISSMDARSGRWHLMENGQSQGYYDAVVIAHNGKCANRLLAPSGIPLVAKQMKRLELSAIWALLAAFKEPLPLPQHMEGANYFDGAFVEGVDSLSWMANNTTKLSISRKDGPHCWTFFSTAAYGQKNKVPQESIPNARVIRVTREMLHGVELALGLPEGSLPAPLYSRVQLWGAALPKNTPNVPCIFDPYGRVGICGDWLLGSSIEAAALSGISLAKHISDFWHADEDSLERFSIGLDKDLSSVVGHDIGQFPGSADAYSPQENIAVQV